MRTWVIMGAVLSMTIMALASTGLGQQGPQRPLPFDPKTIETVQGMVVDAPVIQTGGIPEMEHLTLKTKQGKLIVILGPNWFLAQQDWKISALDRIEVTGSRLDLGGKPGLIAQKVKKGEQVFELRDQSGRPLWAPSRRQGQ
jgi:hypothetical protein